MGDTGADEEITLQEAIAVQEMLESQAVAVLGASDPQNCSYAKGYMKRQALYACLTCNPKGAPFSQRGGLCLGCSNHCHEGHELVELFTKRHFRCDCGNKKFPDNPCRLLPEKDEMNSENVYNQNFDGVYCSCHRPYPDPDVDSETADDPMIQCIVCEDWFHTQHSLKYLNMEDFDEKSEDDYELICGSCMTRLEFLAHYSDLAVKPVATTTTTQESVKGDLTTSNTQESVKSDSTKTNTQEPMKSDSDSVSAKDEPSPPEANSLTLDITTNEKIQVEDSASLDSGVGSDLPSAGESSDVSACPLVKNPKGQLELSDTNGVFWKGKLRKSLCKCCKCLGMYNDLKISYLLDEEDTIEHYEAVGKKIAEDAKLSAEATLNDQLNQLGHVGQLELIHGINDFKEQLGAFLMGHAENGTVIQREDIANFFAQMREEQAAKRRRLE